MAIVGLNVFIYSAVGWISWSGATQESDMRAKMVEDLTDANERLEASMRENAGLHEQLLAGAREAGVLDERQRMAREIHDTLAQGLVGIITQLEAAAQGGSGAQRHTDAALDLARESLAEARRSVQALAPAPLEEVRLPDALAAVGAAVVRVDRRGDADDDDGDAARGAAGGRGRAAAHGAGGAGQCRQARPGKHRRADAVLHGRRRKPRRP